MTVSLFEEKFKLVSIYLEFKSDLFMIKEKYKY